jgi:PIN domain nuclease of toxin-antitoxin system
MRYLLDTHILIWWFQKSPRLTSEQESVLASARDGQPLLVSNITLWEISMLASLGRLKIDLPLREWLAMATAAPLVERSEITPAIAAEVAALPDTFHRDPADRIIVSTARVLEATLLTADSMIRESKLVKTL